MGNSKSSSSSHSRSSNKVKPATELIPVGPLPDPGNNNSSSSSSSSSSSNNKTTTINNNNHRLAMVVEDLNDDDDDDDNDNAQETTSKQNHEHDCGDVEKKFAASATVNNSAAANQQLTSSINISSNNGSKFNSMMKMNLVQESRKQSNIRMASSFAANKSQTTLTGSSSSQQQNAANKSNISSFGATSFNNNNNDNESSSSSAPAQQPAPPPPRLEKKRTGLIHENLPTFYVGPGNNAELIIDIMKRLNWEQIYESNDDSYKFRWVQSTRGINWNTFREGEQMVNHIPNCHLFTNKLNLLCSLQAYEKLQLQNPNKSANFMPLEDYVPLTYKLDDRVDRETFFQIAKNDELWICKPVSLNQGRGIYLIRSPDMLKKKLELTDDGQQKRGVVKPFGRIIQKYITNPLLINKRKFDIRCYMLIPSTKPLLALFHHGYIRLSMNEFTCDDNNLITHLTNQYFQKKDPQYTQIKEDTTWSMEQFNDYMNREVAYERGLPRDWVLNELTKKMQQIMQQVVNSVRYKLQRKTGYFSIYGYDFMIDESMKVWLIEINVNPAITTNTDTLVKAIPPVIEEGIKISLECFDKARLNKKLLPLNSIKNYRLIFNETLAPQMRPNVERSPTLLRRNLNNNSPTTTTMTTTTTTNSNNNNNLSLKLPNQNSPNQQQSTNTNSNANLATSNNNNNKPNNITTTLLTKQATATNMVLASKYESPYQQQQRNALSSTYRRSTTNILSPSGASGGSGSGGADTKSLSLNLDAALQTSTTPTSRVKPLLLTSRTRSQMPLNTLELKPSTVEVYFRNNSGGGGNKMPTMHSKHHQQPHHQQQQPERKSIPTTLFPPPKIGLKS